MTLDLSALEHALDQLESGLARAKADPADELLRDGVIQRFEYTYELSHRSLKRYLVLTEASPEAIELSSFQVLIRVGAERGLLENAQDRQRSLRDDASRT